MGDDWPGSYFKKCSPPCHYCRADNSFYGYGNQEAEAFEKEFYLAQADQAKGMYLATKVVKTSYLDLVEQVKKYYPQASDPELEHEPQPSSVPVKYGYHHDNIHEGLLAEYGAALKFSNTANPDKKPGEMEELEF